MWFVHTSYQQHTIKITITTYTVKSKIVKSILTFWFALTSVKLKRRFLGWSILSFFRRRQNKNRKASRWMTMSGCSRIKAESDNATHASILVEEWRKTRNTCANLTKDSKLNEQKKIHNCKQTNSTLIGLPYKLS